jgi:hypothetical protein
MADPIPATVTDALQALADAKRAWNAAPTDRDHHVRHAAAEHYSVMRTRLIAAVDAWATKLGPE